MRQLSWTDAAFVRLETATTPLHIHSVMIYDPSSAPDGAMTYEGILARLAARIPKAPAFRRKLRDVPLSLAAPYWVDDADFDLEFHVRHLALPRPGDWRQLCTQVARLHSRQLDLSRPPWEMTVIEGVDDVEGVPSGCVAVSMKVHHSVVDGMEGVQLISAIHDLAPGAPADGSAALDLAAGGATSPAPPTPGGPPGLDEWRPERTPPTSTCSSERR